jgi:hypothetical protein
MATIRVFTLDPATQAYRHTADQINGRHVPRTDDHAQYVPRRLRNGGARYVKTDAAMPPPRVCLTQAQALAQLQPVLEWMAREHTRQAIGSKGTAERLVEAEQVDVPPPPDVLAEVLKIQRERGLR